MKIPEDLSDTMEHVLASFIYERLYGLPDYEHVKNMETIDQLKYIKEYVQPKH